MATALTRQNNSRLSMGTAVLWLSVIVLLPLIALTTEAFSGGLSGFWEAVTSDGAVDALRVTVTVSLIVAVLNAVTGTLIAWVLVRDDSPASASSTRSSTCRSPCRPSSLPWCC